MQAVEPTIGFGAKEVGIEVSTDGITWTALAGVPEFAQAPGTDGYAHNTTVDFGGVLAKYVRLTIKSTWGGRLSVASVRCGSSTCPSWPIRRSRPLGPRAWPWIRR